MPWGETKRKIVFIDSIPPTGDNLDRFCWIDTESRKIKTYENGQWVTKADIAETGVTKEMKIANTTLSFENGILKSFKQKGD